MLRRRHLLIASMALALTASLASSAQAVEFTTSSGGSHVEGVIEVQQTSTHVFSVGSGFGSIACSTVEGTASLLTGTGSELEITPTYENCEDSFGRTADWTMGTCKYKWRTTPQTPGTTIGKTTLNCPANQPLTIHITNSSQVSICTVTVHAQTDRKTFHLSFVAGVPIKQWITNDIRDTRTTTEGGFFNCGISNGSHEGGTYTGESVATARTTGGSPLDLVVD